MIEAKIISLSDVVLNVYRENILDKYKHGRVKIIKKR